MSSYLADVKSELEQLFSEAFQTAWKEVVEPALKQSYRNGLESKRSDKEGAGKPRRRFLQRRSEPDDSQES